MAYNLLGNRLHKPKSVARGAYRGVRRKRPGDKEIVRLKDGQFQAERRDVSGKRTVLVTAQLEPGAVAAGRKVRYEEPLTAKVPPKAALASFVVVTVRTEWMATCRRCKATAVTEVGQERHDRCKRCKAELKWYGSTKNGRYALTRCSKLFGAKFTSVYGPRPSIDDDRPGVVRITVPRDGRTGAPVGELVARGWVQNADESSARADVFEAVASDESVQWATDWCWRWAGDQFNVSKLTQEALEYLKPARNDWIVLIEQGRRLTSSSGTDEHMRDFHPSGGSKAKARSARRAAVKASVNPLTGDAIFPGGKDVVGRMSQVEGEVGNQRMETIGFDFEKRKAPRRPVTFAMLEPGVYVNEQRGSMPHAMIKERVDRLCKANGI